MFFYKKNTRVFFSVFILFTIFVNLAPALPLNTMAATKQAGSLGSRLKAFIDSPTGPRTTHFWGPVANWGFVLAVRVGTRRGMETGGREASERARRWGVGTLLLCVSCGAFLCTHAAGHTSIA